MVWAIVDIWTIATTNTVLFLKVLYNNSYSQNNEFRSGRPSKKCKKALYGGAENIHIYLLQKIV